MRLINTEFNKKEQEVNIKHKVTEPLYIKYSNHTLSFASNQLITLLDFNRQKNITGPRENTDF